MSKAERIFVDRKLSTAMFYPCNYGFIPNTKEEDGDPLDVFVLGDDPVDTNVGDSCPSSWNIVN